MIMQLSNILYIPKLLDLARDVDNVNISVLEKSLISGMGNKDVRVFIYEKNGNTKGFIFGSIESWRGEDVVFIQFCVIRPDDNKFIGNELLTKMIEFAKEYKLSTLVMVTDREPKAFMRKYDFKPDGIIMKKEVKNERDV